MKLMTLLSCRKLRAGTRCKDLDLEAKRRAGMNGGIMQGIGPVQRRLVVGYWLVEGRVPTDKSREPEPELQVSYYTFFCTEI